MNITQLQQAISEELLRQIGFIQPIVQAHEAEAYHRLIRLTQNSPSLFLILAEPWLVEPISETVLSVLLACANIHLCLRVIDDAIDENELIHQQNLLRVQPLYWQVLYQLGTNNPYLQTEVVQLIQETVAAVAKDDQQSSPWDWGAKNHHLLLVPLLLSQHSEAYQQVKPVLSLMIALTQACEECSQHKITQDNLNAVLELIQNALKPSHIRQLHQGGWLTAANQMTHDANRLLGQLQHHFF